MEGKHLYDFAEFRVDPGERVLKRGAEPVPLPPKAFDILLVLVQRSERLTLKDDLMKIVWPDTFVEESNLTQNIFLLRKALGETAQEARFIVTVPGKGYRFAVKAKEVVAEEPLPPSEAPHPPRRPALTPKWRSKLAWAGLGAILLIGVGLAYRRHLTLRTPLASPAASGSVVPKVRRSVAVLGFQNLSGRLQEAWLSAALSEMFSTELAAGEQLRIVPSEEVARTKLELAVADTDTLSKDFLLKIRRNLDSDLVVIGSYSVVGEKSKARIRLDLWLQDAQAGETIAAIGAAGPEDDLFGLVSAAGAQLRAKLGVEGPSGAEAASVRASLPSNPEAARFYVRGLARLRVFDALTARDLLQEAVRAEPSYPLSHAALASAWASLGYDTKAKEEARQASQLSSKLSPVEQLLVEAGFREATKDWATAAEKYRVLFELFPDNLDYGLHLLQAEIVGAYTHEAERTLTALRKLPSPARDDPRLDLAEANLGFQVADYKRTLAMASRAAAQSEAFGARLLQARALRAKGAAARLLGDNNRALRCYAEAKEIFSAEGDRASAAGILRDVADTIAEQGDYASALRFYRQSLAVVRQIGFKSGVAADLNNIAVVLENQRNFVAAQRMYAQATAAYREVGDVRQATLVLGNIAETRFYQGDLVGAESRYRNVIEFARQIGDSGLEAYHLSNLGVLLAVRGELADAKHAFEQALSLFRDNDPHQSAAALVGLSDVQLAQGDLAVAQKTDEEALAAQQKLGEKESMAESQMALARIFLEEGRGAEAEPILRQAAGEFQAHKVPDLEAKAHALLARALLEQGKLQEANEARQRALTLAAKSQDPYLRISIAIAAARVRAAAAVHGSSIPAASDVATRKLRAAMQQARKYGFFGLELESRLVLAEIESDPARRHSRDEQLTLLEADARQRGYGLIARKAAAARSASGGVG
jgi:DNA-binding winged helix-turn-helix (wHTH) protein/tetratricopeptide (TPR) repeat protein